MIPVSATRGSGSRFELSTSERVRELGRNFWTRNPSPRSKPANYRHSIDAVYQFFLMISTTAHVRVH